MTADKKAATTKQSGDIRDEWDVVTSTFDGGVIWRRYGDHKIVTTHGETPEEALARRETNEKQGKRGEQ